MDLDTNVGHPRHVSRRELYTDLKTRIEYLQRFLNFNHKDIETLHAGSKYIKAVIPTVVHGVYEKLLQTDITARAFHTRNTVDEVSVDDFFSTESPQIQRRKIFLRWYLTRLTSDPTEWAFWEYLHKVGKMHSGQVRMHPLNIEYVHIGACLGFIQDMLIESIMGLAQPSLQFKVALIRAVTKLIWIQNDLFAKWRVRDGEEYATESDPIKEEGDQEQEATPTPPAASRPQTPLTSHDHVLDALHESLPDLLDDGTSSVSESVWSSKSPSVLSGSLAHDAASMHLVVCPFSTTKQTFETKVWSDRSRAGSVSRRLMKRSDGLGHK